LRKDRRPGIRSRSRIRIRTNTNNTKANNPGKKHQHALLRLSLSPTSLGRGAGAIMRLLVYISIGSLATRLVFRERKEYRRLDRFNSSISNYPVSTVAKP
jgi:hypothetical protein